AKVTRDRAQGAAAPVAIDDAYALAFAADLADLRAVADHSVQPALEGGGDAVHAAYGLQHGGGKIDELGPVELEIGEDPLQEPRALQGLERRAWPRAGARQLSVADPVRSREPVLAVERAEAAKHPEKAFLVLLGERRVERVLAHRLRQQLRDISARGA